MLIVRAAHVMEGNALRPLFVRRVWSRRWVRRLIKGGAITLVAIALVGYVIAPPVARRVAEKQLSTLLGRKVTIGRIRLNPFALSLAVERFQIYEADQTTPFFGFGRLYVNAQLSSIVRRGPVVKEIALEALRLHVVRTQATATPGGRRRPHPLDIVERLTAGPCSSISVSRRSSPLCAMVLPLASTASSASCRAYDEVSACSSLTSTPSSRVAIGIATPRSVPQSSSRMMTSCETSTRRRVR